MYYRSRVWASVLLLTLAVAGWYSARLAWADTQFRARTMESVARAVGILPGNVEYLLFHALQLDYEGLDSTALLERAARLSPLSSPPRIRLGLAAERRGDLAAAERWLLSAAKVDQQFEPRWTLANYYFRHTSGDDFWKWMRHALQVSYGDRRLAFDLCWRMSEDRALVLAKGIPNQHDVSAAYLLYVLDAHPEATAGAAARLVAFNKAGDGPSLEAATDMLIAQGRAQDARALWRDLGRADPLETVARERGEGRGFDWRWSTLDGVTHRTDRDPGIHRIGLSGKQPETCDLLVRTLLLIPGRQYQIRWSSRVESAQSGVGIAWKIGDEKFPLKAETGWKQQQASITARAELTTVTLTYQRPAGEPRLEGSVDVRDVSVSPIGGATSSSK